MAGYLGNCCMSLLLVSTMLAAIVAPGAARAADACLDNRAVQALIASHQIKTWPAIKALAGISDQYKEVCGEGFAKKTTGAYYVVNVAGPSGESKQLVLNAVDGSK